MAQYEPYIYLDQSRLCDQQLLTVKIKQNWFSTYRHLMQLGPLLNTGKWSQVYNIVNYPQYVVKVVPLDLHLLRTDEIKWEEAKEWLNDGSLEGKVSEKSFEQECQLTQLMAQHQVTCKVLAYQTAHLQFQSDNDSTSTSTRRTIKCGCLVMQRLQYTLKEYALHIIDLSKSLRDKYWKTIVDQLNKKMIKSFGLGKVHRDLHEENIMINTLGNSLEPQSVYLIDFGLVWTPEEWISFQTRNELAYDLAQRLNLLSE